MNTEAVKIITLIIYGILAVVVPAIIGHFMGDNAGSSIILITIVWIVFSSPIALYTLNYIEDNRPNEMLIADVAEENDEEDIIDN